MHKLAVEVNIELFEFGFTDTNTVLLIVGLLLPILDYVLDIFNIYNLTNTRAYSAIGKMMLFNFILIPMVTAFYKKTKYIENKLQELSNSINCSSFDYKFS